jgi:hypothetical protein
MFNAPPVPPPDWAGTVLRWAITLMEPLISPRTLTERLTAMDALVQSRPDWARVFFAGAISSISKTLPEDDPWRQASARLGGTTVGGNPPGETGAVAESGDRFGTWHDFEDTTPMTFGSVADDPQLAAAEVPLDNSAAAIVVISFGGWRVLHSALVREAGFVPHIHWDSRDALRWAILRRRSYGLPPDDDWIWHSCFSWAIRAANLIKGEPADDDEIEREIKAERILPAT